MHGWDSGYADELEAVSAFLDSSMSIMSNHESKTTILDVNCVPRTAANARICFVSCRLRLIIPSAYPAEARPSFQVLNVSGMLDEGKRISDALKLFVEDLSLGDCMLFQIIEKTFDCLDEMNDGECMICADSLSSQCFILPTSSFSSSSRDRKVDLSESAVKSFCGHTFHYHCLAKWAAISLLKRRISKKANLQKEKDELLIRASEGQVKSSKLELESQQKEKVALEIEIADMQRCIDYLKAQPIDPKTDVLPTCEDTAGIPIVLSQASSRLQKASNSLIFIRGKIQKLENRIVTEENESLAVKASLKSIHDNEDSKRMFPCPYCRFELSGRFISNDPECEICAVAVDTLWNNLLESYLAEESAAKIDAPITASIAGSSTMLDDQSPTLIEYIRKVQAYQTDLKKSLRCQILAVEDAMGCSALDISQDASSKTKIASIGTMGESNPETDIAAEAASSSGVSGRSKSRGNKHRGKKV